MIDREAIIHHLQEYTSDELIYKRYYELRNDPDSRAIFLKAVENTVRERYLFIPEYPFIQIPELFTEKTILLPTLPINETVNVHLLKHSRYTPIFEHMQDYFEIIYVLSGKCGQTVDNEQLPLLQGDLCFIPPFTKHTIEVFDDSVVLNIHIRRETFDDIFFNTLRANSILSDFFMSCLYSKNPAHWILFSTGEDEEIRNLILDMYQEILYRDEYSKRLLSNMVPLLFVKTLRGYAKTASMKMPEAKNSANPNALRLISYINDHYKSVTLETLARQFNYSVPHCSKLIKEETGISFIAFVRRVRMNHATSLLKSTSNTIADIASMVGYENTESFIRAFQKELNQSPTAYRKIAAVD